MANFCLPPHLVEKFKKGLINGEIDPGRLSQMSSEDRNKFLGKYVGENEARSVNALFEEKLLLKNQKQGMITWAKSVAGLKPELRKDLVTRISRLDRVLDPVEQKQFFKDLASTKLGFDVTPVEAKTIADLSKKVESARSSMEKGGDRLAFGRASVALSNYVNDLKRSSSSLSIGELKRNPAGSAVKLTSEIAGNTKAINASLDNSAIFRQGWKTLLSHPGVWQKNARQSFKDLARQFGGKEVMDEVNADIVSRPNYDKMVKAKLNVGTIEEDFPTSLPEKIPGLGRAYKASEAAYTAFVHKTRADVFDKYLDVAEKSGVDINNKKELESIGRLVNSLTGRGHLGSLEPVANVTNNVFFSPRFLKSNIDTLTAHQLQKDVTPFVRKQAAKNLLKIVTGTAAILAVANAVKPGSVEWDPRSSDYGKIKIGNTRFDVTGGMSSIATLSARLGTTLSNAAGLTDVGNTKSATTHQVTKLNSGAYGGQTSMDVVNNFFENKLSPVASVVRDILKGEDPQGNKPTAGKEIAGLVTPLGIKNYQELKNDPHSANNLAAMIADGLGIATNTYGPSKSDWNKNPGLELTAFKQKVGDKTFKKANDTYNTRLSDYTVNILKDAAYKRLPDDQKKTLLTKEKDKLKNDIFKENGFKYRTDRNKNSNLKQLLR